MAINLSNYFLFVVIVEVYHDGVDGLKCANSTVIIFYFTVESAHYLPYISSL